jgi:hypothetical protein
MIKRKLKKTEGGINSGLSRDKGNIGHKAQNEVKQMDYLETKATLGTKQRTKSNKTRQHIKLKLKDEQHGLHKTKTKGLFLLLAKEKLFCSI